MSRIPALTSRAKLSQTPVWWVAVVLMVGALFPGLVALGCNGDYRYGCDRDGDCRGERVCRDGLCVYPEEPDLSVALDELGALLAVPFLSGKQEDLWPAALTRADYRELFEWPSEAQLEGVFYFVNHQLLQDFQTLRNGLPTPAGLVYERFEPGDYLPLAPGEQRARDYTDRLRDNRLILRAPDGQEVPVEVKNVIRLHGRWRVFCFVRPFDPAFVFGGGGK